MAASILVINSDSHVRKALCAALEVDGHAAVGASTYYEAILQLRRTSTDLAISDGFTAVGLAGMSTLHRLFPMLRMLVMSGGVSRHASISLSHPLLSILPKSCPMQTILGAVRQTLAEISTNPLQSILECGRFDFFTSTVLPSARA